MKWSSLELSMSWSVRKTRGALAIRRQRIVIADMTQLTGSWNHRQTTSSQVFKAISTATLYSTSTSNVRTAGPLNRSLTANEYFMFPVAGEKYEKPQRRASVCSLDSGTSLSFLSSNGTRGSDNQKNHHGSHRSNYNQPHHLPSSPLAAARSTEV